MALSDSYDFTLTAAQLIASAHRKLGISTATATQNTNALEALELILKGLSAKGFNLVFPWVQEWIPQALVASTASYTLDQKVANIDRMYIRRDSNDTPVTKMSNEEYTGLSAKTTEGKPNQIWINKQLAGIKLTLYPVPENATDVLYILAINKFQDVDSTSNNIDIDSAWFEALLYTLASRLGPEPGINASTQDINNLIIQSTLLMREAKSISGESSSTIIIPG